MDDADNHCTQRPPEIYQVVPDGLYALTALTSAFMHADIWHLGGNMLFIWVFGDNVEDAMGLKTPWDTSNF